MRVVFDRDQTKLNWLVADHLGTPRIEVDQIGLLSSVKRHDYLPFGEELFVGMGGYSSPEVITPIRSTDMGYSVNPADDRVRQRFNGHERDGETGLDFFQARYFSSTQGRFISPDWSEEPEPIPYADLTDPQSLNLYGYTRNNPLLKPDPDGHSPQDWWQRIRNGLSGRGFNTDAEIERAKREEQKKLAQDAYKAAEWLKQHGADPEKLSQLSNQQVVDLYNAVQRGESSVTTGGTTIEIRPMAPALKGDPYHPDSVRHRINNNAPWRAAEAQKEASKVGSELVKQFKQEGVGQSAGRSGGHGAPFARAGAELIRRAKSIRDNPDLKNAYLKEGQRLINEAKGHSHK